LDALLTKEKNLMVTFPEIIRIKIINKSTRQPIANIAVKIKLFANKKNDYHFLLPLSDHSGNIEVSREWLNQKIQEDKYLSIMDYSSNLEDCQSKFEISVLDNEAIKRAIVALNIYKAGLDSLKKDIDNLSTANNLKYSSYSQLITLGGEKIKDILVEINNL
jgi:hypothetical protein